MSLTAEQSALAGRLGHDFARPELLIRALTHGSIASATRPDNQRLEFLGDRVLGLVMAEALLEADTKAAEGQLAPGSMRLCARKPVPRSRGRLSWARCCGWAGQR